MIPSTVILTLVCLQLCRTAIHTGGILYPRASETREVITLDGIWDFAVPIDVNHSGLEYEWYKKDLKQAQNAKICKMPVPASYNDITTDWRLRDHVGLVWYGRTFFVPKYWSGMERVWIRFGSVSYSAQVWINGELVMSHEIGHLPFLSEITNYLKYGIENSVTVACDNTLLSDTIPQGNVHKLESGRLVQHYNFDFFNYAGIDRPVYIYTTPKTYIDDITVATVDIQDSVASLEYKISIIQEVDTNITGTVSLLDKNGFSVASSNESGFPVGSLKVENPILWWPYLMDPNPGYMYTFQVELIDQQGGLLDKYSQPIGIRKLSWTNTSFFINNKPLYLHGFGRHEDSDIRGKGVDLPLIIKDHNLIQWVGANAYRTSHYPYAEEIMDVADELGIMIIDECPAVSLGWSSNTILDKHKISLTELIQRDKNRPAVIMWSAANEPGTGSEHFRHVIEHIKSLDKSRPTTIVENRELAESSRFVDIISINFYTGWYGDIGNLDVIISNVINEVTAWHEKFNKPVIMQEYGAGTLTGLHFTPSYSFTEEYQVDLISQHFIAFDHLRKTGFFIGEFIWNFADFNTAQCHKRSGGNRKGIFTRNRQPKASAHHLRKRYWGLAQQYANVTLPDDLISYTIAQQQRVEL